MNKALEAKWARYCGFGRIPRETVDARIRFVSIDDLDRASPRPQIAWLGHASFLLVWRQQTLLFDPAFSRLSFTTPRRFPVARRIFEINPDAILVSHAHMDHLDNVSLRQFPDSPIILPENSQRFLDPETRPRARGIRLGSETRVGSLSVVCVPALHGGWRYPWQKGYFACGYIVSDGATSLYFAGDTAYGDHFKSISRQTPIDFALLPIGAYAPRWFLRTRHMNPVEAIQAFFDLEAKTLIPCHFGSYRLSLDPLHEAFPWFAREAERKGASWSLPIVASSE